MSILDLHSTKGNITGTLEECARWLAEYQPSVADIDGLDVSFVEWDPTDIPLTVRLLRQELLVAQIDDLDTALDEWDSAKPQGPEASAAAGLVRHYLDRMRRHGANARELRLVIEQHEFADAEPTAAADWFLR